MNESPGMKRHHKTRADHASEVAEDYVEAIAEISHANGVCRVVDLATRFGVSAVTVNRTVARLVRDGFASTLPYAPVELTAEGARLAKHSKRRHQIVYDFLIGIGVSSATAAVDAEGIEHHVSPETLRKLQAMTKKLSEKANLDLPPNS